jgi:hypothetical protein
MEKRKLTCVGNFISKILDPIDLEKHNKNYIGVFEQNGSRIKRFRKRERGAVDEAPLERFQQLRSDNVPVRSPLLVIIFVLLKC